MPCLSRMSAFMRRTTGAVSALRSRLAGPLGKFEHEAFGYFRDEIGRGYVQRVDGVACFAPFRRYWFWRARLEIMAARGLIGKKPTSGFFPSCDGMRSYGIPGGRQSPRTRGDVCPL